ncbi:MAG: hypothetical protein K0Q68_642 [Moraxellaceae bacterium]|jgi:predicted transcriptional regulator|nr:hypothetical protein [Moraxellaceae bacterium]
MDTKNRIIILTEPYEAFVHRTREAARRADAGDAFPTAHTLTFHQLEDLLMTLSPPRCRLLAAVLTKPKTVPELQVELRRGRKALREDIAALAAAGLLVEVPDTTARGRVQLHVQAAASQIEIRATIGI